MRNDTTDSIAVEINKQWAAFKADITKLRKSHISEFIRSFKAYDIIEPFMLNTTSSKDVYAAFHIIHNGLYVTVYYWHSIGEWFVKT